MLRENISISTKNHTTGPILLIPEGSGHVLVPLKNVVRIETAGSYSREQGLPVRNGDSNYSFIFLANGDRYCISRKLSDCAKKLEVYGFVRPHQSHLINLAYVERINGEDGVHLVLNNDDMIPVAYRKRADLVNHPLFIRLGIL